MPTATRFRAPNSASSRGRGPASRRCTATESREFTPSTSGADLGREVGPACFRGWRWTFIADGGAGGAWVVCDCTAARSAAARHGHARCSSHAGSCARFRPRAIGRNGVVRRRTSRRDATGAPASGDADHGFRFMAGITVVSTLGLAAAMLPALESRVDALWPWQPTQRLLLFAFPVAVAVALVHLALQQRRAAAMQRELVRSREQATERAQRQNARLAALLDVSRIMGTETGLQNVFDAVTTTCRDAFECDQVTLMLLERDGGELVIRSACGGKDPARLLGTRWAVGQGIAGVVAQRGT